MDAVSRYSCAFCSVIYHQVSTDVAILQTMVDLFNLGTSRRRPSVIANVKLIGDNTVRQSRYKLSQHTADVV